MDSYFNAKWFDGNIAVPKDVTVKFDSFGIHISFEGSEISSANWSKITNNELAQRNDEYRLALNIFPQSYLVFKNLDGKINRVIESYNSSIPIEATISKKEKSTIIKLSVFAWIFALFVLFGFRLSTSFLANFISPAQEEKIGDDAVNVYVGNEEIPNEKTPKNAKASIFEIYRFTSYIAKKNGNYDNLYVYLVTNGEFNAFALPGNKIIINCGLIAEVPPEGTAFAIAHEISHLNNNDIMKPVVENLGLEAVFAGLTSNNQANYQVAMQLSALSYSREIENRADRDAVEYLLNAGYTANGAKSTFQAMEDLGQTYTSRLDELFASHSTPQSRIELIESQIAHRTGNIPFNPQNYQELQAFCRNPHPDFDVGW